MTAGLSSRSPVAVCEPPSFGPVIEERSRLHPIAQRIEIARTRVTSTAGGTRSGRLIPASCVDWGEFHVRARYQGGVPVELYARRKMFGGVHYNTIYDGGGRIRMW